MERLKRRAKKSVPERGVRSSLILSLILNILTILTARPFNLLPKYMFYLFFTVSIACAWRYLLNYKTYTLFEFESLYADLKHKSVIQKKELLQKKIQDPYKYYSSIIEFFSNRFPGLFFEYKMTKKMQNSEDYLDPAKKKSKLWKAIRKGFKLLMK